MPSCRLVGLRVRHPVSCAAANLCRDNPFLQVAEKVFVFAEMNANDAGHRSSDQRHQMIVPSWTALHQRAQGAGGTGPHDAAAVTCQETFT